MTVKGDTNRRWTSTDKYRDSYERIFRKGPPCPCDNCEANSLLYLGCVCDVLIDYNMNKENKNEQPN